MANSFHYFIRGFFNLEFFLNLVGIALYPVLRTQNYIFDFARIPSELVVAVFTACIAIAVLSWRTCFKFFSVFGSSHPEVKKLETFKKVYFLLWGLVVFQGMLICQAGCSLLLFYSGEVFLSIYVNLYVLLILVVSYLTLQVGMVKYHEILRSHNLDVGAITE